MGAGLKKKNIITKGLTLILRLERFDSTRGELKKPNCGFFDLASHGA
jgi:hypothetical protein